MSRRLRTQTFKARRWLTAVHLLAIIAAGATAAGCSGREPSGDTAAPAASSTSADESREGGDSSGPAVVGTAPVMTTGLPAIVVLEPRHQRPLPAPDRLPVMDQEARTFLPPILFVRAGHPAEFRNSDEEIHNINVKDASTFEQAFNVAVPSGGRYVHTFERAGVYDVSCDIHAGMWAQIVSAVGPYATVADAEGRFSFQDVVPGTYALTVYAGSRTIERVVEVTGPETLVDATGS